MAPFEHPEGRLARKTLVIAVEVVLGTTLGCPTTVQSHGGAAPVGECAVVRERAGARASDCAREAQFPTRLQARSVAARQGGGARSTLHTYAAEGLTVVRGEWVGACR